MKKRILFIFATAVMLFTLCIFSSAEDGREIYCIARDGDTVNYPAYSEKAVQAAKKTGAAAVSVGVVKTADGVLVTLRSDELEDAFYNMSGKASQTDYNTLSKAHLKNLDGSESDCTVAALQQILKQDVTLIIDGWEYRDEIAAMVKVESAEDRVKLRGEGDSAQMAQWSSENGIDVIGIYYGNIIFSACSHIKNLSAEGRWIQLQSGNYFSVLFNNFVMKRFEKGEIKAICPMYDGQLCGQRTDTQQGYDDIIGRGYSVIETNQPQLLLGYIEQLENEKQELADLTQKAKSRAETGGYSTASAQRLDAAIAQAEAVEEKISSRLEIEKAYSELIISVKALCAANEKDTNVNSLNITAGKLAAVVIFGSLVVAAQIYVYRKKKK